MANDNFPGLKDPRKQSMLGRLADRDVVLAQQAEARRMLREAQEPSYIIGASQRPSAVEYALNSRIAERNKEERPTSALAIIRRELPRFFKDDDERARLMGDFSLREGTTAGLGALAALAAPAYLPLRTAMARAGSGVVASNLGDAAISPAIEKFTGEDAMDPVASSVFGALAGASGKIMVPLLAAIAARSSGVESGTPEKFAAGGLARIAARMGKDAAPARKGVSDVIKEKGGNWLTGSVEGAVGGLRRQGASTPEEAAAVLGGQGYVTPEVLAAMQKNNAMNSFIDKQLTNYIKKEMATPEDPIRALAERGVLHIEPNMTLTQLQDLSKLRESLGFSAQPPSESTAAQYWNNMADASVFPRRSGELLSKAAEPSAGPLRERISSDRHWMQNVPKDTLINTWRGNQRDLGFPHLIDELSNALNPESGLPRHLLLDPASMSRVSVPQAVERVSQINAWRAAQKAEADMLRANNAATVLHKEYPEKGMKWVELRQPEAKSLEDLTPQQQEWYHDYLAEGVSPEGAVRNAAKRGTALQDALKYEGDTMGHCVGGYCDDVASGRTKIYSLRDAKGQPHVTVEVAPGYRADGVSDDELSRMSSAQRASYDVQPSIKQIKGKANRAPNPEYLPFVQDFVRSGKWSDVGDLHNTGLQRAGWAPDVLERMKAHGIEAPEYGTADEINAALNALNKAKGFAEGGPVGTQYPRIGGGLSKAAGALRRAEEERQFKKSVFAQPREERWVPEYEKEPALEAPMISPDDLLGTGIPTKIAMALKGAAPLIGGLGVIKNKGGNWLNGSVEGALKGLKMESIPLNPHAYRPETVAQASAMNNWIDKQLTRYVKNEMATPEDPIRALAERNISHMQADPNVEWVPQEVERRRRWAKMPEDGMAQSDLAKQWEVNSDFAIEPYSAGEIAHSSMRVDNPWAAGLDPNTPVHKADDFYGRFTGDLGFSHLIDELSNALNPESGLPRHLLLDPKSMDRVSVPQAVERVAEINKWRAAQKAEADMLRANNAATVLHKEYPDKGFKWVELRQPERLSEDQIRQFSGDSRIKKSLGDDPAERGKLLALQDALKYEGDTMGHCVGGYCDDVASGRTKIYSLRDAKGQPHVTVETRPNTRGLREYLQQFEHPEKPGRLTPDNLGITDTLYDYVQANRRGNGDLDEFGLETLKRLGHPLPPDSIVQIKGKANRAPNEEYLPFVQDFVKSGKWSDVGDLHNTGLVKHPKGYFTKEELGALVDEGDYDAIQEWQRHYIDR